MRLFNSESGTIEPLDLNDVPVGMYVCGVTPYDTTHVGHAFTFLTFDIIKRYLNFRGIESIYVQNVTDIDDDILRKAKEKNMSWLELGQSETAKFRKDMAELNAIDPDHYTKATEHTPEMIALIEPLIESGFAYVENGNVYFEVSTDPEFGKLSKIPRDEMLPIANERGNTPNDPNKRDPLDFVLWQAAAPGEPTWPSPWSDGRPGWHIECSAMSMRYLGPSFAIHGGGGDLLFPHHECEIAQSENATGVKPFSSHWVHVGMVEYDGEKMSKSLGNLVLVSDLLENYSADAIRLYCFSHHYRSPWEFVDAEMDFWQSEADKLVEAATLPALGMDELVDVSALRQRFLNEIEEDLDTVAAIRTLQEIGIAINESNEDEDIEPAQATLIELAGILGLSLTER